MISETTHSNQTKMIGYDLHVSEQGIGYSNLTLDPQGARGGAQCGVLTVARPFFEKNSKGTEGCSKGLLWIPDDV